MRSRVAEFLASVLPAHSRRDALTIATEALGRYKLRTALSVLGVILGVAAVIAMMSVSEGARRAALLDVEHLGLNNLVARSRSDTRAGGLRADLVVGDAEKLAKLVPYARAVSPLVERAASVSHGSHRASVRLLGVESAYQTILGFQVSGRFLTPIDDRTHARVCVLGETLANRLFSPAPAVGQWARIDGEYYRVVGVIAPPDPQSSTPGALAWRDVSIAALVPLSTLLPRLPYASPHQPIDEMWIQVSDADRVQEVSRLVSHTLARLHDGAAFDLVVPRELLAQRYRTQRTFSIVIGSVAVLALIVGGIGIMNIMLTSVVERTHEIGIRRTVGATRRDVAAQFLLESVLMTMSGGTMGIVIGVVIAASITAYAGWATYVSAPAIALGFSVSAIVGVGFGIFPALKASHLEPVDALRHE